VRVVREWFRYQLAIKEPENIRSGTAAEGQDTSAGRRVLEELSTRQWDHISSGYRWVYVFWRDHSCYVDWNHLESPRALAGRDSLRASYLRCLHRRGTSSPRPLSVPPRDCCQASALYRLAVVTLRPAPLAAAALRVARDRPFRAVCLQ
jgi:hypothetical protein